MDRESFVKEIIMGGNGDGDGIEKGAAYRS